MQGQSLEKKTELLIIPGESYLLNVQIILYFRTKIRFIIKREESSVCSNLLHAHFLAKLNLIQKFKQECLIFSSILVEQCLLFNI